MKATVVGFRGSHKTQDTSQMILFVDGVNSKESASSLIDKMVVWTTPGGKKIEGKVIRIHGNSGAIRARFERGLPGQSIGTTVEVIG
ncbi:50S ribosomal protein L35ae [Candidatus Woesearchaeota archaeon]|nr:50S ribosomal protein L35ae [Candidatus Woesearchaeota archaeon]